MSAVHRAIHRLLLPDGSIRLARGDERLPRELLPRNLTLTALLAMEPGEAWELVRGSEGEPVPEGVVPLAPIEDQPVWAAGVTYKRSRDGRVEESVSDGSVYDRIYDAVRPELFFKAHGADVVGPDQAVGVRRDSEWNAPEPELVVVLDRELRTMGFAVGNDVSSRSIEGANPLYLPQAKVYERSCAIGPAIVEAAALDLPAQIELTIHRGVDRVLHGRISTASMRRTFDELVDHLGRAHSYPTGCFLMTGTGIVPPSTFTLQEGDVSVVAIAGLGTLRNPVVDVGRAADDAAVAARGGA